MDTSAPLSTAQSLALLFTVAASGLALGELRVAGVRLGSAGVLFAGLLVGAAGFQVDHAVMEFLRELGLMLFVFMLGLQLGPGFFASLRKKGLPLNALALGVALSGVMLTLLAGWFFGMDPASLPGLFSGSTTNTPSLGAAQQAMTEARVSGAQAALPALAYAASYPVGIAGIIISMLVLRRVLRVDVGAEVRAFEAAQKAGVEPLQRLNILVDNERLDGLTLGELPGRRETGVAISRLQRAGSTEVVAATDDMKVRQGDQLLLVGTAKGLEQFQRVVGRPAPLDLLQQPGEVSLRRVLVTNRAVLGKSIAQTGITALHAVAVTRIVRAGVEMTAVPEVRLQFGDMLHLVGAASGLEKAAKDLGDSLARLNQTQFIPIFAGLVAGVLLGLAPMSLPGLSSPLKLGMAGGPLIVALVLSRVGRLGPLVWHMPANTNHAFRELGMTLFLACVGLAAGPKFFATVMSLRGVVWALSAAVICVVPLLAAGLVARRFLKMNFMDICGLLTGSMTDPPALAFASSLAGSDTPAVAYATVYPATMIARIICAQVLVVLFFS